MIVEPIDPTENSMIKAWSMSRADTFEACAKQAYLKFIDKIPEPDRGPPPKGMTEWHNDRGHRVHDQCEKFVKGEGELPSEAKNFEAEFIKLRALYAKDQVTAEQGWGFTHDWTPCEYDDFDNIWLRVIVDAMAFRNPYEAVVIDYKTGKRKFNEIKHGKQVQLYQLAAFIKFPNLEKVTTELWYLDQNELFRQQFTRTQGMRFFEMFNNKGKEITEAIEFPAKPGRGCFFCPYKTGLIGKQGPMGTGHCADNPR